MINGSRVVGPALAALLALAGFSTAHLFLVNAATYLFLIVAILAVAIPDLRFRLLRLGGFSPAENSAVPHNALHYARALRDHVVNQLEI